MNFSRRGALMRGVGFSIVFVSSGDRHDALLTKRGKFRTDGCQILE